MNLGLVILWDDCIAKKLDLKGGWLVVLMHECCIV
jgi:hypothetical protein